MKPKTRSRAASRPAPRKVVKPGPPPADSPDGALLGGAGLAEVRRLIRLVQSTGIGELEVSSGGRSVRISTQAGRPVAVASAPVAPAPAPVSESKAGAPGASPAAPSSNERFVAITSPMVGTFYRAPAPDADPYVEMGDMVDAGQTVCIIEAMKLMNTIESEKRGRVVEILVENAQPVEFGQKLFLIDPA